MLQASLHVHELHFNEVLDCSFNYWIPIVDHFALFPRGMVETVEQYVF